MQKRISFIFLLFLSVIISVDSCRHDPVIRAEPLTINLRWNQAYSSETEEQVLTGLRWCLSFLSANLPAGQDDELFQWKSSTLLQLDLTKAGFHAEAFVALSKLIPRLKESEEYVTSGGIDIGRFVMLTLNSSHHYYAITAAAPDYLYFRNRYTFETKQAAVIESEVSKKHRLVEFPGDSLVQRSGYVSHQLNGSLLSGSYTTAENEVMDIMPNGQLRFAVYDVQGKRQLASDTNYSRAGKPAKCLWCHEINIQIPHTAQTEVNGFYTPSEFKAKVASRRFLLDTYRQNLPPSSIDFNKKQDHTQMELLYISFMEPSAERLAIEWNVTLAEVMQKTAGLPTHLHTEFPFLGVLYNRKDVDPLSPYRYIRVPDSARELSGYEPNLIY
jgi:hypothetical protein